MKKYQMLIGVIVIAIVIVSITMMLGMNNSANFDEENTNNSTKDTQNTQELPSITLQAITEAELSSHNNSESCWIVYKGKVYDLTSWIPQHPGGARSIERQCGTLNFEEAFIKKHGTSKSDLFMKVAIYMGDLEELGNIQ